MVRGQRNGSGLRPWWLWLPALASLVLIIGPTGAEAASVPVGAGSYSDAAPAGGQQPQGAIFKTADLDGPMPTNDWWSSTAWKPLSERQFPHPLGVINETGGLRVYYPGPELSVPGDDACICGIMPMGNKRDLVIGHNAAPSFTEARVAEHSDWFVTNELRAGSAAMRVSYGHGSPYVYATYEGGGAELRFEAPPVVWSQGGSTLGVTIADGSGARHYGIYAPSGASWQGVGTRTLTSALAGRDYLSVALLPDASEATLERFGRYAHNHPTDTRATYSYDRAASTVRTDFEMSFDRKEGDPAGTIFALYPHQWRNSSDALIPGGYDTVRGRMKLREGEAFSTEMRFNGVLPSLPDLGDYDRDRLRALIDEEQAAAVPQPADTYGTGKRLGRLATIAPIADQLGDHEAADQFRAEIKQRLEDWFTADDGEAARFFAMDRNWGSLLGYEPSFGSIEELSDHHFHYGYFIKAAAEVARVDPEWARDSRWGGMVRLLIRDIAESRRDDADFPYLRNFDPYAGHSWASGRADFGDGNNQESSSEAINAWAGIILFADSVGDAELGELGTYLYTTERNAIDEYWFDTSGENFHPDYDREVVTMVWGGKGADATWFSAAPERVHGINYLPITGASLYLGLDPDYAERNYQDLLAERGSTEWWHWEDLVWQYRALSDPEDAAANFDARIDAIKASPPNGSGKGDEANEAGNSLASAYHWIHNLKALGQVDASVTADHSQYAVFRKGTQRTYVVYNPTDAELTVNFSDGKSIVVAAHSFNQGNGEAPDPEPEPEPDPEPDPTPDPDPTPEPSPGDSVAPTIEIHFPSELDVLLAGAEVGIYGSAADETALGRVEVSVRDTATDQWYRADGSWGGREWHPAPIVDGGAHWRWLSTPPRDGHFELVARATDGAGNTATDSAPMRVGVTGPAPEPEPTPEPEPDPTPEPDPDPTPEPGPGDSVAPTVKIGFPSGGAILKRGDEVGVYGRAADEVALDRVEVAVRDTASGEWYRADGGWGAQQWHPAPIVNGADHWRWLHAPPRDGSFELVARAVDRAGNTATDRAPMQVGVPSGSGPAPDPEPDPAPDPEPDPIPVPGDDTVAPTLRIEFPSPNDILLAGDQVGFWGLASDDVALDRVDVALRDSSTGEWYRSDGSWGAKQWQPAPIVNGADHWRWLHTPSRDGRFELVARAVDSAGNVTEAGAAVRVGVATVSAAASSAANAQSILTPLRRLEVKGKRRAVVVLRVHCQLDRCRGKAILEARHRRQPRTLRLGATRFSLQREESKRLRIKLRRKALRRTRSGARLTIRGLGDDPLRAPLRLGRLPD